MKTIPLTRGLVAIVDDSDFNFLNQFKWNAQRSRKKFYAAKALWQDQKRRHIFMHRLILDAPESREVDHKDGNGLNNQRENLRLATRKQNLRAFRPKRSGASSQFRGVCWNIKTQKWMANIGINRELIYLGLFFSEKEAALAYDTAARKYFGEFASPNFP